MIKEQGRGLRIALLISAAPLAAVPALAQEVAAPPVATAAAPAGQVAPVAPPVVTRTVPDAPAATTAAPESSPSGDSPTRVNPEAAAQAAAEDAERRAARPARAERRTAPARQAAAPSRQEAAPAQTAPAAVAPAAPAATQAQPAPATPTVSQQPAATEQPATADQSAQTTSQTTTEQGPPMWPLALIALLIVAAGAAFFVMRRRKAAADHDAYEPAYEDRPLTQPEAVPAARPVSAAAPAAAAAGVMVDDRRIERANSHAGAAPVAAEAPTLVTDAAPVAAEEATVTEAHGADVAALTATETRGDRPWLEFAMRPVRAGTNVDEALVEIELTVANAGNMPAEDVRISTFMLPAGNDSEMERLLVERHDEAVTPLTIGAGEGTRVDAMLVTSKADLVNGAGHAAFQPVIVADARYRLPDGSEGRTSASFVIGGTPESGDTLEPISLDRPLLREDVEARLYREPARV